MLTSATLGMLAYGLYSIGSGNRACFRSSSAGVMGKLGADSAGRYAHSRGRLCPGVDARGSCARAGRDARLAIARASQRCPPLRPGGGIAAARPWLLRGDACPASLGRPSNLKATRKSVGRRVNTRGLALRARAGRAGGGNCQPNSTLRLYVVRPSWTLRRRCVETHPSEWPRDAARVSSRVSVAAASAV